MSHIFSSEQRINHVTPNNQFSSNVTVLRDGQLFFTYTSVINQTFQFEDIFGRAATIGANGDLSFLDAVLLSAGDRNRQQDAQAWAGPFLSSVSWDTSFLISYTDAVPISISFTAPGTVGSGLR